MADAADADGVLDFDHPEFFHTYVANVLNRTSRTTGPVHVLARGWPDEHTHALLANAAFDPEGNMRWKAVQALVLTA